MQVSIVVNTYNRAGSLADLLAALPYQTHGEFELIVVAGPCTDDTAELLRAPRRVRSGSSTAP